MSIRLLLTYSFIACFLSIQAQNTVGLLSYQPYASYEGYNLIYPDFQPDAYLLNNCGEIVNIWKGEEGVRPAFSAYLLEDGNFLTCRRPANDSGSLLGGGGAGGLVELRDWDNNLLWHYEEYQGPSRLHHDIQPMPNGNVLMIAWELKTAEQAIAMGRNPELLPQDELWPDKIIEYNPSLDSIVWEWHAWDHMVQDFDPSKPNFAPVHEHPELIDLNWETNSGGRADWLHINAVDYKEELDQIMLSSPYFDEIWIIDHSTTTEEAAGHTGGKSGRGGDLMYRWGNPQTYRQGIAADQRLFFQHDSHWVDNLVDPSNTYYDKVALFNNRIADNFSTGQILSLPEFDETTWSYPMNGDRWGPENFDKTIVHPIDIELLHSTIVSGIQVLPNENILLCSGRQGYYFELNVANEVVWEYIMPLANGTPVTQGENVPQNTNLTFRMQRYGIDYPAFEGRNMTGSGYIELSPDVDFCEMFVGNEEVPLEAEDLTIYPNPASQQFFIECASCKGDYAVQIFDATGRQHRHFNFQGEQAVIEVSNWENGIYFIRINKHIHRKIIVAK